MEFQKVKLRVLKIRSEINCMTTNVVYNLKQSFAKNVYFLNVAMIIDLVVKEGRY